MGGSAQADMDPGLLVAWSGGGVALAIHLSPPIVIGAPLSLLLWWNAADLSSLGHSGRVRYACLGHLGRTILLGSSFLRPPVSRRLPIPLLF